ncbi:MAG: hypothetical protein ACI4I1_02940 [Oscillospiraceae bacterium]
MRENSFVGYEYRDVTVKRNMASVIVDGYENFGWEVDSTGETIDNLTTIDKMVIKFKRDRKIRNKAELTRLQRNFDACISDIDSLEKSKFVKPSVVAYLVGIIGTAFMAGSVFCVIASKIIPCIILAVPAFIGWVLPYFLYKSILKKKTEEVTPLIDEKYDEIYTVCEKANALLDSAD